MYMCIYSSKKTRNKRKKQNNQRKNKHITYMYGKEKVDMSPIILFKQSNYRATLYIRHLLHCMYMYDT